jgi:hypothetical protein
MFLSLLFHNHFFILQFHILDFQNEYQRRKKKFDKFIYHLNEYLKTNAGLARINQYWGLQQNFWIRKLNFAIFERRKFFFGDKCKKIS